MVLIVDVVENLEYRPESSYTAKYKRAFHSSNYSQVFLFGGDYEKINNWVCGEENKRACYWI